MNEASVSINGKLLTEAQSMTLRVMINTFDAALEHGSAEENNDSHHQINSLHRERLHEISNLVHNKSADIKKYARLSSDEIKARNKAIHDAIELNGEDIESQVLKYNLAEGTVINLVRKHKLELIQNQTESDRLSLLKSSPLIDDSIMEQEVNVLGLSARSLNALKFGDIYSIADLIKKTDSELAIIPNLGLTSISEIKLALSNFKLKLNN